MNIFKLIGEVVISNSKAIAALNDTDAAAEGSQSKMSSAFSKIGHGAAVAGKAIATGLAVGATAMTGLVVKSLNMAGDLEQNMGGSEAVFKEYAEGMQSTAQSAYSQMGLSASDFLATANKMGALFQGAGFDIQQSSELSAESMQRAADVASIMGISTESAMEAIAGAAKGNFTMMDNLGVAMNDTAIQNYALSKGIDKSTASMTQQEKIGLAMEMFMDKTAYAAGNYAKENETLAGSLSTAKSALSNFLSGTGTVDAVVSSVSNAADVIVKNVKDLVPKLVAGITSLINQLVPMISPLLKALLPGIVDGAVQLINGLVDAIPILIDVLVDAAPALISGFMRIVTTLLSALPQIIQPIVDGLPTIIITIINVLLDNLPTLIDGCIQIIIGLTRVLPQIIAALIQALPSVLTSIVTALFEALPLLLEGAQSIMDEVWNGIWIVLQEWFSSIGEFFAGLWESVKEVFEHVVEFFGNIFSGAWDGIKNVWNSVTNFFSGIWSGIQNIFGGIGTWFSNIFKGVIKSIKNIWSGLTGFFKTLWNGICNVVKIPINWIIDGINSLWSGIYKAVKGIVDTIGGIAGVIGSIFGQDWSFSMPANPPLIPKLAEGGVLKKGQVGFLEGDGDEAVVPLEQNTGWINRVAARIQEVDIGLRRDNIPIGQLSSALYNEVGVRLENTESSLNRIADILLNYFPQLLEAFNFNLVMDDGTVAAKLTPLIDSKLGEIYKRKGRGS